MGKNQNDTKGVWNGAFSCTKSLCSATIFAKILLLINHSFVTVSLNSVAVSHPIGTKFGR